MRRAGVLLHPTSLPGPWGIGEIGPAARELLGWLEKGGQSIWMMLPLVPIDGSGSPYSSASAMARNPLILSLDDLVADGWLLPDELPPQAGPGRIDFPEVIAVRTPVLNKAAERATKAPELDAWAAGRTWAHTWALFAALAEAHGPEWTKWEVPLRDRDPAALAAASDRHQAVIRRHLALQWLFDVQWKRLEEEAKRRGISLWGDVPFFVGGESCDVWAHRNLFRLDAEGRPSVQSGVPPDAFSETGQLWGHPLYDEKAHRKEKYRWWIERVSTTLELVDTIRLDHFRGVAAYWEVPMGAEDATGGTWIPGPGQPLLDALKSKLGRLPFVAEDLGVITPDVEALRDDNELPGMAILQFAFGDPDYTGNFYLPHNHKPRQVVFPGTHDNDTAIGWYATADERTRDHVRRYLLCSGSDIAGDLVRWAFRSVAETAIVPVQDVLGLGGDARMNVPGQARGNWGWRLAPGQLDPTLAERLADQARITGRVPARATDEGMLAPEGDR
jgi:4-alpha-glucanotransferase